MNPVSRVLELLKGTRRIANGWTALCPAHEDRQPSLGIAEGEDGRVLLKCRAGCDTAAVIRALGLDAADLFVPRPTNGNGSPAVMNRKVYAIKDAEGRIVAEHVRIEHVGGSKRFSWERDGSPGLKGLPVAQLPLYGSDWLRDSSGVVVVVEGEKAADAGRRLGLLTVGTVTGASSCPGSKALDVLRGRDVALWPDADDEGRRHMERLGRALQGVAARIGRVVWEAAPAKADCADFEAAGCTADQARALLRWDATATESPGLVRLADAVPAAMRELDRFASGDFSDYVPSATAALDRKLGGGLRKGQVSLLGGPTGSAKTTIMGIVCMNSARQRGPVLLVSPEMGAAEIAEREILRASAAAKWRRSPWRSLSEETRASATRAHHQAADRLAQEAAPLFVLDRPSINMDEIQEEAEALRKRRGLALIAIDYAQEVAELDPRQPRYLAVGAVAQRSVALARELQVPVLIASQVNVTKEGSRTIYSFRESQILEHKAHNVLIFVVDWRESPDGRRTVESAAFRATKNRSGPLFELPVSYEPELFSIRDIEEDRPEVRLPYADRDEDDLATAATWERRRA